MAELTSLIVNNRDVMAELDALNTNMATYRQSITKIEDKCMISYNAFCESTITTTSMVLLGSTTVTIRGNRIMGSVWGTIKCNTNTAYLRLSLGYYDNMICNAYTSTQVAEGMHITANGVKNVSPGTYTAYLYLVMQSGGTASLIPYASYGFSIME